MFHLKDGLSFIKLADGKVAIIKQDPPFKLGEGQEVMRIETDLNGLASVMASMSNRGETGDTYREALAFLTSQVSPSEAREDIPTEPEGRK